MHPSPENKPGHQIVIHSHNNRFHEFWSQHVKKTDIGEVKSANMFTHVIIAGTLFLGTVCLAFQSNNYSGLPADREPVLADSVHKVGEKFGGGIVFHVTDGGRHGLIVALTDQADRVSWSNGANKIIGLTNDGFRAGIKNTIMIVAAQENDKPYAKFAAKICADYTSTQNGVMYDDWYLPSRHELALLFANRTIAGIDDKNYYYWTSNEEGSDNAWVINFYDGSNMDVAKSDENTVRAIRAF